VIDTHSPNSPISSDRSLAMYPRSWMHSSISAAVNGVLMASLLVVDNEFGFEPSTISREVTRFATLAVVSRFLVVIRNQARATNLGHCFAHVSFPLVGTKFSLFSGTSDRRMPQFLPHSFG